MSVKPQKDDDLPPVLEQMAGIAAVRRVQPLRFWVALFGGLTTILVWRARPSESYWIVAGLIAANLPEVVMRIAEVFLKVLIVRYLRMKMKQ